MENPKVRKGFCAALLEIDPATIKETILIKNKTERTSADDKYGVLDVKILMLDGTQIGVEMQIKKYDCWDKRILFYMSKSYTSQIHTGDQYEQLKKCIHASILSFIEFPEDDRCYHKIKLCDIDTGKVYTDMFEIHIMELEKVSRDIRTDIPIIRWMKFFNCKTREEFENMKSIDEYIQEAYEELVKFTADKDIREEYEAREKILRDNYSFLMDAKRQGLTEGRAEGLALAKLVIKAYASGKTVKEISEEYNISEEDINVLLD